MENGTLAYVNYVAKVKDTGEVLEATREEDAKNLGIFDPVTRYTPRLVAVGEGWVLKGLDEVLAKANVGEKLTAEIPPEKGFGERDITKIKLVHERKFGEKAHELAVGAEVEVDGKVGTVRYIGSGRVQVDFNHRLAGKTLIYDLEVVKAITEPLDVVKALLLRRLPLTEDKLNVTLQDDKVTVNIPEEIYFLDGLQFIKKASSTDIFKFAKGVKEVTFIELYKAPEEMPTGEKPKQEAKHVEAEAKETPKTEAKAEP